MSFSPQTVAWTRGFFADYRDSALARPRLDVAAERTPDGWSVHVSARDLVRDLTLLVDRVQSDATVDQALVTLLPGESVTLAVSGAEHAQGADFSDPSVLRTANDLL